MQSHQLNKGFHFTQWIILSTGLALILTACNAASTAPTTAATSSLVPTNQAKATTSPTSTPALTYPTPIPLTTSTEPQTTAPTTAPATPTPASRLVSAPALQYISMQDANNGWGLSQDAVFLTTDGGTTWANVTPKDGWQAESIVRGFFLDTDTGWLIQPRQQDFDKGILYRTLDGGQNWQVIQVPFGPNQLQFLNTQDGWVMADRGVAAGSNGVDIYKTTDGGTSWTKVQSAGPQTQDTPGALPFGGDKTGMAFSDMIHGWIGGFQPIIGHSYLYSTADGGKTWTFQDLAIPPDYSSSSVSVYAPKFFTNQDGVLPVTMETQVQDFDFYITHDGGQTWQSTTVLQNASVYDITSMQDIWVWAGKTLEVSHDSGQTWEPITPNISMQGKIKQVDFVNQETGWATSMDANENIYLYKTTDGGHTWTQLSN